MLSYVFYYTKSTVLRPSCALPSSGQHCRLLSINPTYKFHQIIYYQIPPFVNHSLQPIAWTSIKDLCDPTWSLQENLKVLFQADIPNTLSFVSLSPFSFLAIVILYIPPFLHHVSFIVRLSFEHKLLFLHWVTQPKPQTNIGWPLSQTSDALLLRIFLACIILFFLFCKGKTVLRDDRAS